MRQMNFFVFYLGRKGGGVVPSWGSRYWVLMSQDSKFSVFRHPVVSLSFVRGHYSWIFVYSEDSCHDLPSFRKSRYVNWLGDINVLWDLFRLSSSLTLVSYVGVGSSCRIQSFPRRLGCLGILYLITTVETPVIVADQVRSRFCYSIPRSGRGMVSPGLLPYVWSDIR